MKNFGRSSPAGFQPHFLQTVLILLAGFWVYWPALHGPWLWDDTSLIEQNPLMKDPAGLWKIWLEPHVLFDYFPGTATVEWLEWHIWGDSTVGYHFDRIILHLVSALLLWHLLEKLGLRLAWLGGLLFAVHPVAVESVAWIAELKNTLSLPPFLLAMCAWIDWDRDSRRASYWTALIAFLIAALCKATVIMFPFVILLYAWWRRDRIAWNDLREAAPFFAVSLGIGLATLAFVRPVSTPQTLGLASRLDLAGLLLAFYFSKSVLPIGLMPIYPKWSIDYTSFQQWLPWCALLAMLALCWMKRATWGRSALLGLGFFFINLAPFAGLVQGAYMEFTWAMEHMLYIPLIGLIGLFVAGVETLNRKLVPPVRLLALAVLAGMVVVLAFGSRAYAELYGQPTALWAYNTKLNPASAATRTNYGEALAMDGRIPDAAGQFEAATQLSPSYLNARLDLAKACLQLGRSQDAIREYQTALQINPADDNALCAFGNLYVRLQNFADAKAQYEKALRINPENVTAHYGIGALLLGSNQLPGAIDQFQQALAIDPNRAEIHFALANAYSRSGQAEPAGEEFSRAVEANPNDPASRIYYGVWLAQQKRIPEAAEQFEAALRIDPNNAPAHYNLGSVYFMAGQLPAAIAEYQETVRIDPNFSGAKTRLARALALQKANGAAPATP